MYICMEIWYGNWVWKSGMKIGVWKLGKDIWCGNLIYGPHASEDPPYINRFGALLFSNSAEASER